MQSNDFNLKWENDEKSKLLEQVENQYDESTWMEAVKRYEEALAKQPDHPEYLHSYGYLLQLKAKRLLREAAKCYQKGIESDLSKEKYSWISDKLHAQLIQVRGQLFEAHKSIEFYKNQIGESPEEPKNYCFLVQCYLQVDQIHEAKKVFQAGIKLFPVHALLTYFGGEIHARFGHIEEALMAWEKSATLDPQLVDGRFSRAFLLEREQRLDDCAQEWKNIIEFMNKYGLNDDLPRCELDRIEKQMRNN